MLLLLFLLSLGVVLVVLLLVQVRHKPNVPLPLPGRKMEGKRSEETLQIRLYAVDCPEVAHFGNPAQAFSAEAKEVKQQPPVSASVGRRNQQSIHVHLMFSHRASTYEYRFLVTRCFSVTYQPSEKCECRVFGIVFLASGV